MRHRSEGGRLLTAADSALWLETFQELQITSNSNETRLFLAAEEPLSKDDNHVVEKRCAFE